MRIEITQPGIFNAEGKAIAVGTELTVKSEPTAWAGRYRVLADGKDKTPVNNTVTEPSTAKEALALFSAEGVHPNKAKAMAAKFLGDKVPTDANKEAIVAKLTELAAAEDAAGAQ
ncbi:hypothetical protein [Devosia lacusdianchii]|uniref:hypothetical protein n=1 Tax=Devosia lacusdianchii TaxID=2917991 RepID=UPI001F052741|nr:hypothetical protein [Devosia sp. JXJ CY 41]